MPKDESPAAPRVAAVDAYRGLVMFLMMAEALRLSRVAQLNPDCGVLKFLAYHQTHAEWAGCSLHDLIQPSFSFLVGVALPFSIAARLARGQSRGWMVLHAAWRALLLSALGIFLRSVSKPLTNFTFEDTLTQIGLGYVPLFLLGLAPSKVRWGALVAILVGYWAAFAWYPLPGPDFDYAAAGAKETWEYNFSDFAAHWNKNTNLAWAFDTWFLNVFPREKPFAFNGGGYATLSFIPTLGTMLLGLIAGDWLRRSPRTTAPSTYAAAVSISQPIETQTDDSWSVIVRLAVAGAACMAAGLAAHYLGICPSVKRIWTPAWTLFSGGWCFFLLAAFYATLDAVGLRAWAFPLRVIGMNSIAAYCMAHVFNNFIISSLKTHLGNSVVVGWFTKLVGEGFVETLGTKYQPLVLGAGELLVYWLILFWMVRRRLFLRI